MLLIIAIDDSEQPLRHRADSPGLRLVILATAECRGVSSPRGQTWRDAKPSAPVARFDPGQGLPPFQHDALNWTVGTL
jgi:hypothetical protein